MHRRLFEADPGRSPLLPLNIDTRFGANTCHRQLHRCSSGAKESILFSHLFFLWTALNTRKAQDYQLLKDNEVTYSFWTNGRSHVPPINQEDLFLLVERAFR